MRYLFIHGSGCTGDAFAAQVAAFNGSIALTLPGHADGREGPGTIAAFADAVAGEIDRLSLRDVIVCGNSMGGAIALELALRALPALRAIVLLGSGVRLRVAPAIFESLEADFPAAARRLATMFFARPDPDRIDAAIATMLRVGQRQTIRDFRACDAFDATERIVDLHVPLLALTGERDVLTPPNFAQWFGDRVPGAEARIVPDAGHLAMVERPEETNAALRAFEERCFPR
ncbi:MAG TPA: alpha/beta fold hydrolase [Candidatus Baltobacteraceae bacterium]|jgi:pimeloyl-ACP methyl ester carboxylesterase|nr:alpha/beta fold hydrolase [Candidatus Baltobacteraceae bacterium]